MKYIFKIDEFEGPMDLLLELVKKEKIDIFEVSLDKIIDEYLEYIKVCETLNIDIASSYLDMASDLLLIKSRKLLPRDENDKELEDELLTEEVLREKLIEHDKLKNLSNVLFDKKNKRNLYFEKDLSDIKLYTKEKKLLDNSYSIELLINTVRDILNNSFEEEFVSKIPREEVSVKDRVKYIKSLLSDYKKIEFCEFFKTSSKKVVVASFLAILEMIKDKYIIVVQDNTFDKIYCEVVNE